MGAQLGEGGFDQGQTRRIRERLGGFADFVPCGQSKVDGGEGVLTVPRGLRGEGGGGGDGESARGGEDRGQGVAEVEQEDREGAGAVAPGGALWLQGKGDRGGWGAVELVGDGVVVGGAEVGVDRVAAACGGDSAKPDTTDLAGRIAGEGEVEQDTEGSQIRLGQRTGFLVAMKLPVANMTGRLGSVDSGLMKMTGRLTLANLLAAKVTGRLKLA
ncbi:hypothetical protein N8J89_00885 [Crossiella sp. CA-258035]|uniref:hypothetical protein n=1 Tax=Crossiella sp. CA-258035 TaxID=2981138 RepID=UPI0024BC2029|nr:hypothetical protein [Crossiella sp. CA-258035]WHT19683.1 hypothetical protein N8J89_00885 [Crossiella sp. CA-258035]